MPKRTAREATAAAAKAVDFNSLPGSRLAKGWEDREFVAGSDAMRRLEEDDPADNLNCTFKVQNGTWMTVSSNRDGEGGEWDYEARWGQYHDGTRPMSVVKAEAKHEDQIFAVEPVPPFEQTAPYVTTNVSELEIINACAESVVTYFEDHDYDETRDIGTRDRVVHIGPDSPDVVGGTGRVFRLARGTRYVDDEGNRTSVKIWDNSTIVIRDPVALRRFLKMIQGAIEMCRYARRYRNRRATRAPFAVMDKIKKRAAALTLTEARKMGDLIPLARTDRETFRRRAVGILERTDAKALAASVVETYAEDSDVEKLVVSVLIKYCRQLISDTAAIGRLMTTIIENAVDQQQGFL